MLPVDTIRIPVLARPEQNKDDKTYMDMPIIPPHLLVVWLLRRAAVSFSPDKAQEFWDHHRRQGTAFMLGRAGDEGSASWEPWALYGDKAEYTITKEKLLVLFCSSRDFNSQHISLWLWFSSFDSPIQFIIDVCIWLERLPPHR